jgi:hypothetical protein
MKAVGGAFLAAVLIQPLVFGLLTSVLLAISLLGGASMAPGDLERMGLALFPISLYVVVVAGAVVALLGIPTFVMLRRTNSLGWHSILTAGFLAAALPYAIIAFPLWRDNTGFSYGANWHGTSVQFVSDGVYTIYGWLNYIEEIVRFGIHGLAGAAMFYLVWLRLHEPQPGVPADGPRPAASGAAEHRR